MGFVSAKISDLADIREFDCALSEDALASAAACRLAELTHFPLCGPDSSPLRYGFVEKGGRALDPQTRIGDLMSRQPLQLRLVPELSVADNRAEDSTEASECTPEPDDETADVRVNQERSLIHDDHLELPLDVRIDADAHKEIEDFAAQDRYTECAGLLLGSVTVQGDERVVHVHGVAPASEAKGSRTSVRLTAKALESALKIKDLEYPQMRTLGWFHTHSGSGVHMSDSDTFLHKRFFQHPNMVAHVLDATSARDGFFYWHNGVIGLRPSYGLVCTVTRKRLRDRFVSTPSALRAGAIVMVLGGVLYLGFAGPAGKAPEKKEATQAVSTRVEATAPAPRDKTPADKTYTIGPADNFWKICNRHYGDGDLAKALARYNGIRDLQRLQLGQKIKLPPKEKLKKVAGE